MTQHKCVSLHPSHLILHTLRNFGVRQLTFTCTWNLTSEKSNFVQDMNMQCILCLGTWNQQREISNQLHIFFYHLLHIFFMTHVCHPRHTSCTTVNLTGTRCVSWLWLSKPYHLSSRTEAVEVTWTLISARSKVYLSQCIACIKALRQRS